DGIRGFHVTGVQTCAFRSFSTRGLAQATDALRVEKRLALRSERSVLDQLGDLRDRESRDRRELLDRDRLLRMQPERLAVLSRHRSEERRVGKECSVRWSPY